MAFIKDDLGAYLREQRQSAKLTLRQLAELAEVSNPYLSQIERGLKRPSAEILQSLAKGLRVSAESLYVRAGILEERDDEQMGVEAAILGDHVLSERQKSVLLEIYESFRSESSRDEGATARADEVPDSPPTKTPTRAATKVAKKVAKQTARKTTATRDAPVKSTTSTARTAVRTSSRRSTTKSAAPAVAAAPSAAQAAPKTRTTTRTTTPRSTS